MLVCGICGILAHGDCDFVDDNNGTVMMNM